MCGEKQSIKQAFFTGNGKDCRMQVQSLNFKHRELESKNEVHDEVTFQNVQCVPGEKCNEGVKHLMAGDAEKQIHQNITANRWEKFIEKKGIIRLCFIMLQFV